jgi:predicted DNA-binding mobile mystery protein A
MSIKKVIQQQYRDKVNQVISSTKYLSIPPEGWLRTVRKALNMSGAQLARRMNVSRAQVSQAELAETSGNITLKKMQDMAESMNCRFIYAVVPEQSIDSLIKERAITKAKHHVHLASTHMALEDQLLNDEKLQFEINRVAQEYLDSNSKDLWND